MPETPLDNAAHTPVADPVTSASRRFPRVSAVVTLLLAVAVLGVYFQSVQAHRFHNDDAYISFRYARHLADGLGLVWNPGERVEGYSNLLWVLLIAGGMKFGIRAEPFADVLSVTCGALLLFSLAAFSARRLGWRSPWILAAPAILATHRSFGGWATSGMETMLFALLVWVGWSRFLLEREERTDGRTPFPWSALALAAAALTRPDGLLFGGLAGLLGLYDLSRGRWRRPAFVRWAAPLTLIVGTHFLWRRLYYGFWWPNTFYAKVNSLQPEHGLLYFAEFAQVYSVAPFLLLLPIPLLVRHRPAWSWLFVPMLSYCGYLLAIGGDTFEFRFLVFLLPLFYGLLAEAARLLGTWKWRRAMAMLSLGVWGLLFWSTRNAREFDRAADHQIRTFDQLDAVAETNRIAGLRFREMIDDGTLREDLIICLPTVGALPYLTGWETVDYHGLNDVRIARMPATGAGRLAHEHEAPIEYLIERRVDLHLADRRGMRKTPKLVFNERQEPFRPYWKNVPIGDEYLSFASYVSDERFQETFGALMESRGRRPNLGAE